MTNDLRASGLPHEQGKTDPLAFGLRRKLTDEFECLRLEVPVRGRIRSDLDGILYLRDLLTDGSFQHGRWESEKEQPLVEEGSYLCFHVRFFAERTDEESKLSRTWLLGSCPSTRMMRKPRVGSGFMLSVHLDVILAAAITGRQCNTLLSILHLSIEVVRGLGVVSGSVVHFYFVEKNLYSCRKFRDFQKNWNAILMPVLARDLFPRKSYSNSTHIQQLLAS